MTETFFNLGQGEQVIKEIKPKSGLRWYFFINNALLLLFMILYLILAPLTAMISSFGNLILTIVVGIIIWAVVGLIVSSIRYNKQYYWITNFRIIYKRGFLGYKVTSIPYERISDIIISRGFMEKIFGFGSLHIQTLAGQVSANRMGAEGSLVAIPDPEGIQELIFQLIKKKRKNEKISF